MEAKFIVVLLYIVYYGCQLNAMHVSHWRITFIRYVC